MRSQHLSLLPAQSGFKLSPALLWSCPPPIQEGEATTSHRGLAFTREAKEPAGSKWHSCSPCSLSEVRTRCGHDMTL